MSVYKSSNQFLLYILAGGFAILFFCLWDADLSTNLWTYAIILPMVYWLFFRGLKPSRIEVVFYKDFFNIETDKLSRKVYWENIKKVSFKDIEEGIDVLTLIVAEKNPTTGNVQHSRIQIEYEGKKLYDDIRKEMRQRKELV